MSNLFETRELQRCLLNLLIKEDTTLRMRIHEVKEYWFNSPERKFILNLIIEKFNDSKSRLTEKIFQFEINNKINEKEREIYLSEWNLIVAKEVEEGIDVIIETLKESTLAKDVRDLITEAGHLIEKGEPQEAYDKLKKKVFSIHGEEREKSTVEFSNSEERKKLLKDKKEHPEIYCGLKTGFNLFDERTAGLFKSEMTIISAVTGVGKSTLLKQITANLILQGKDVLHITNEEHQQQVELKYDALFSDLPYFDFKSGKIEDEDIDRWDERMKELRKKKYGRLFIKEIPMYTNVIAIEKAFYELEQRGTRPEVLVIDYMDHLSPIVKSFSENDNDAKVSADCKGICIQLNIPLLTATQSATVAEAKQDQSKRFGKMDVYGSKRKVHAANTLAYIREGEPDRTQLKKNGGDRDFDWQCDKFWTIQIAKNRDGGNFEFKAKQHVKTGRIEELSDPNSGKPRISLAQEFDDVLEESQKVVRKSPHIKKDE